MTYEKLKKEYNDIIKYIENRNTKIRINEIKNTADNHLKIIWLYEKYGIDVGKTDNASYIHFDTTSYIKNSYCKIYTVGGDCHKISYPAENYDLAKKVEVLAVGFPTGAYVFSREDNTKIFSMFFEELKTYKPDYIDNMNKVLYFKLENAKKILDNIDSVFKTYSDLEKKDSLANQIQEAKNKLRVLQK